MARLLVYPAWRDNPYINLLYLAVRGQGWDVTPTIDLDELCFQSALLGRGDAIHLHWTQPVCQETPSAIEARARLDRLVGVLTAARERGVALLWTVHNHLPHELLHRDLELELIARITALASRVIQINAHTVEAVADAYELPREKVVTLPHSSYRGIYPDDVTRQEARTRLGVPPTSPTIGFVGQIRPYKGIVTLLRAAALLGDEVEDLTLLLAGSTRPEVLEQIESELPAAVRTVRHHGFVDDADLQVWFRAADVMVFPYERVLNSGSVLLSATFGRSCVLPAEPHLEADLGGEGWVSFYPTDADPAAALATTARQALLSARDDGRAAEQFAARYTPYLMSRDYAAILASVTTSGGLAA